MSTRESEAPVSVGLSSEFRTLPLLYCKLQSWAYVRKTGRSLECSWVLSHEFTFANVCTIRPAAGANVRPQPAWIGSATVLVSVFAVDGYPLAAWTVLATDLRGYLPADLEPDPLLPDEHGLAAAVQEWAVDKWAECTLPGGPEAGGPATGAGGWRADAAKRITDGTSTS
jgi:hypothetical protein